MPSTFGQRFLFARDHQRHLGRWVSDADLAALLGLKSQSDVSAYKKRQTAPPAERVLVLAKQCEVDPGWLAFGEDCAAPPPVGFAKWLENKQPASDPPTYPADSYKPAESSEDEARRGAK